jgi:Kef-type K+ transport system membrane component KefB
VVIIVTTTRLLSLALSYMNQPRVIAEVLAGIILGPSVLGYIPGWIDTLFPSRCPIHSFSWKAKTLNPRMFTKDAI